MRTTFSSLKSVAKTLDEGLPVVRVLHGHTGVGRGPGCGRAGVAALVGIDDHGVHLFLLEQADHRVGQLDLAALAGTLGLEELHDARREQIAAHDEEVGRRVLGGRLLDEPRDLPDGAGLLVARGLGPCEGLGALARDDTVAAHLVGGHGRHGDDGCAAVRTGDLGHLHAHLAVGHKVVTQQDKEGLVARRGGGAQHGVAQALGVVLIDEGHRQGAGLVHGLGLGVFAVVMQILLELSVFAEIGLDLRLFA